MEQLLQAIEEAGMKIPAGTETEKVLGVAKALGLDPVDYLPREVEIVEHTNKRKQTNTFVKTGYFVVGRKENGRADTVRGPFIRLSILDELIEDLNKARDLRDANLTDGEA